MKQRLKNSEYVIGIDEAGRGPLAGPVTVGAFWAPARVRAKLLKILGGTIKDSKQLSPDRRIEIIRRLRRMMKEGEVNFAVCHISNLVIDKIGISKAVSRGIVTSLSKLHHTFRIAEGNPRHACVRLDGLLKAPEEYKNQKTIIKGDEKDVFIACASIVAKVARDALMCRLAQKFPAYCFEIHKGYGTKMHRDLILQNGLCSIHRRYFCRRLTT